MKKGIMIMVITVLFFVTGCTKKNVNNDNNIENSKELLSYVSSGVVNNSLDELLKSFPNKTHKILKKVINSEEIKYNIVSLEKTTDKWTKHLNDVYSLVYLSNLNISECFEIKGSIEIKGSKTNTTEKIDNTYYCNFDGNWKLLFEI